MAYISIIFAKDLHNGGFGYKNTVPWKIPEDLKMFKQITTKNSADKKNNLIMGRKTWESFKKPLPNRREIVVTTKAKEYSENRTERTKDTVFVSCFEDALISANISQTYTFVIGGVDLIKQALTYDKLENIYVTLVKSKSHVQLDTFMTTPLPEEFTTVEHKILSPSIDTIDPPIFHKLQKINKDSEYVKTLRYVLDNGEIKDDRTKTGTISVFGDINISFDLQESFPLETGKFVPFRLVFVELMWMLRGQTNIKFLEAEKCMIWHENHDSEYGKKIREKYNYPNGELGPLYGSQWRNFGGKHVVSEISDKDAKDNTKGRHIANEETVGIDQIKFIIEEIKRNPNSRRLLVSAWNPLLLDSEKDKTLLDQVTLPACHSFFQFNVRKTGFLDCKLYMRSNDLFLGAPFNIASYALLTHMIAALTNLKPGKFYYTIGDAHIYKNHLEQVGEVLSRTSRPYPKLSILNVPEKIEDFQFKDIKLEGYNPHPAVKADMAV